MTNWSDPIGQFAFYGYICMRNDDIGDLFSWRKGRRGRERQKQVVHEPQFPALVGRIAERVLRKQRRPQAGCG